MVSSRDDALAKPATKLPVIKRPTKKKPKDKPKRPLSAYNFFFKEEREKIIKVVLAEDPSAVKQDPDDDGFLDTETINRLKKEGGKVSFEEMGKIIGQRWKNIDPDRLSKYAELAAEDTERYKTEMQAYNGRQEAKMRQEALKPPVSFSGSSAAVPGDRPVYPDARAAYGDMTGAGFPTMGPGGMGPGGMGPGGPASMGPGGYGYGYGDFSGYGGMGMSPYGGGMPMGYGGYSSQPMDHQAAYGGASYGAMGMMGASSFQGGMPMGYPDQGQYGASSQMDPTQQQPPPGTHPAGAGGYNASTGYGGVPPPHQGNWGQQG
mmetsp:Transcript_11634/g.23983  ORF Transcript_11634/g.23983 Transcript_11634/m.23983 type:complete len:319 (-) Transcript_11634:145-1101(-)|eukprot:CAMPEP_0197270700 /NCGR_PEP_ID=MMETSP1432-20130617/7533_1 /TAXON_ID=44447 /ORGANISM="Pseudo-nitzschia delicatissima, Strain UNC1205" /LENGTH=318 /DNA_ID=CAMNT_0042736021 /DNA_START=124 /DNA_END=1080 /DNA_ORIENTATION=-